MMTDDEIIAVVKAHKDGQFQWFNPHDKSVWNDDPNPTWDFHHCDYRVKPEQSKPREWWVEPHHAYYSCQPTQIASSQAATIHHQKEPNSIHVREVIEWTTEH